MAQAKEKAKKSLIPKRISNRIEEAFSASRSMVAGEFPADQIGKEQKRVDRDKKVVLDFIEDLLADTVD